MTIFTKRLQEKTPNEVKEYLFDFTDLLTTGETISTYVLTSPSGITVDSDSKVNSDTGVEVWVSTATAKNAYEIWCKVVTSDNRTYERAIIIPVIDY